MLRSNAGTSGSPLPSPIMGGYTEAEASRKQKKDQVRACGKNLLGNIFEKKPTRQRASSIPPKEISSPPESFYLKDCISTQYLDSNMNQVGRKAIEVIARFASWYTQFYCIGVDKLQENKSQVVILNHGFETFIQSLMASSALSLKAKEIILVLIADKLMELPLLGAGLKPLGGTKASPYNFIKDLLAGNTVALYPGGIREANAGSHNAVVWGPKEFDKHWSNIVDRCCSVHPKNMREGFLTNVIIASLLKGENIPVYFAGMNAHDLFLKFPVPILKLLPEVITPFFVNRQVPTPILYLDLLGGFAFLGPFISIRPSAYFLISMLEVPQPLKTLFCFLVSIINIPLPARQTMVVKNMADLGLEKYFDYRNYLDDIQDFKQPIQEAIDNEDPSRVKKLVNEVKEKLKLGPVVKELAEKFNSDVLGEVNALNKSGNKHFPEGRNKHLLACQIFSVLCASAPFGKKIGWNYLAISLAVIIILMISGSQNMGKKSKQL